MDLSDAAPVDCRALRARNDGRGGSTERTPCTSTSLRGAQRHGNPWPHPPVTALSRYDPHPCNRIVINRWLAGGQIKEESRMTSMLSMHRFKLIGLLRSEERRVGKECR